MRGRTEQLSQPPLICISPLFPVFSLADGQVSFRDSARKSSCSSRLGYCLGSVPAELCSSPWREGIATCWLKQLWKCRLTKPIAACKLGVAKAPAPQDSRRKSHPGRVSNGPQVGLPVCPCCNGEVSET